MTGIYIHIPFCNSKCPYCDFYSLCNKDKKDAYVNALINSISSFSGFNGFLPNTAHCNKVDSVYIGGGTPCVLSGVQLCNIIDAVRHSFFVTSDAEITVEANPSDNNLPELFAMLANAGVNRMSLGMQSAIESERRALGRRGSIQNVKSAVLAAKKAGINNVSVDVMLGVPGQTEQTLINSLNFALSLNITHLSCYMLQLEKGTLFYKRQKSLMLPNDDTVGDMYMLMCSHLKNANMRHYEISSFCFDNKISRHNMKYWTLEPYIGFGASAHSFYGNKRFFFERDIDKFINGGLVQSDGVGGDDEEKLMLLLRTDSGVDTELIKNSGMLPQLINNGLVYTTDKKTVLTEKGMLLSNSVIASLI